MRNWNVRQNLLGMIGFGFVVVIALVCALSMWFGAWNPVFGQIADMGGARMAAYSFALFELAFAIVGFVSGWLCGSCRRVYMESVS